MADKPPRDPFRKLRKIANGRGKVPMASLRVAEINWLIDYRYPDGLSADQECLQLVDIMLQHLARLPYKTPDHNMAIWLNRHMKWLPSDQAKKLTENAKRRARHHQADTLGKILQLTDDERTALKIKTIAPYDITREERAERQKEKHRERCRLRRRAKSKRRIEDIMATSNETLKPWITLNISRRTYYRWQKLGKL